LVVFFLELQILPQAMKVLDARLKSMEQQQKQKQNGEEKGGGDALDELEASITSDKVSRELVRW
jgi:protein subunit release factor A